RCKDANLIPRLRPPPPRDGPQWERRMCDCCRLSRAEQEPGREQGRVPANDGTWNLREGLASLIPVRTQTPTFISISGSEKRSSIGLVTDETRQSMKRGLG